MNQFARDASPFSKPFTGSCNWIWYPVPKLNLFLHTLSSPSLQNCNNIDCFLFGKLFFGFRHFRSNQGFIKRSDNPLSLSLTVDVVRCLKDCFLIYFCLILGSEPLDSSRRRTDWEDTTECTINRNQNRKVDTAGGVSGVSDTLTLYLRRIIISVNT